MVAAEAAAAGCPPLVARHSGLAEVADGLEAAYPPRSGIWRASQTGDSVDLAREAPRAARACPRRPAPSSATAARRVAVERWSWAGVAETPARTLRVAFRAPWVTRRSCPATSCSRTPASEFENGTDLPSPSRRSSRCSTRRRSSSSNRFEELQAAAAGRPRRAASRRRADRLRGRGAHRPLRELRRGAGLMVERRAQLAELAAARDRARRDGHAPVEPLAGPADHRHAALPAKRRAPPLRRLAEQHLRPSRPRRRSAAPTARSPSTTGCASFLPDLLALSASSPFVEDVNTACTPRARRSSRACSRAAASPTRTATGTGSRRYVRTLYETGSIDEHTQLWWSVRPHLAFPTVEIRICDAPARPRRGAGARRLLLRAHRPDRARGRRGRAAAAPPQRMIEENLWRAIRYGLSGELIDPGTYEVRAGAGRARAAREWVRRSPTSSASPLLGVPRRTRPSGRSRGTRRARRSRRSTPSRCAPAEVVRG